MMRWSAAAFGWQAGSPAQMVIDNAAMTADVSQGRRPCRIARRRTRGVANLPWPGGPIGLQWYEVQRLAAVPCRGVLISQLKRVAASFSVAGGPWDVC